MSGNGYCGLKAVRSSAGKLPKDSPKVALFTGDFVMVLPHLGIISAGQTGVGEYVVRLRLPS